MGERSIAHPMAPGGSSRPASDPSSQPRTTRPIGPRCVKEFHPPERNETFCFQVGLWPKGMKVDGEQLFRRGAKRVLLGAGWGGQNSQVGLIMFYPSP